jgi:hypothetical protein
MMVCHMTIHCVGLDLLTADGMSYDYPLRGELRHTKGCSMSYYHILRCLAFCVQLMVRHMSICSG